MILARTEGLASVHRCRFTWKTIRSLGLVLVKMLSWVSVSSLALGDCVSEEVTLGSRARS